MNHESQGRMDLGELLGVRGEKIQWERPLLIFTALYISSVVIWYVLSPSWIFGTKTLYEGFSLFHFASPQILIGDLIFYLSLFFCLTFLFRLVKNEFLALLTASVAFPVLSQLLIFLASFFFQSILKLEFYHPILSRGDWRSELMSVGYQTIFILVFFGTILILFRMMRNWGLALLIAVPTATFLLWICDRIFEILFTIVFGKLADLKAEFFKRMKMKLEWIPFSLLRYLLFAFLVWLFIRFLSEPRRPEGAPRQRLPKGFFLGSTASSFILSYALSTLIFLLIWFGKWTAERESYIGSGTRNDVLLSLFLDLFVLLVLGFGATIFCIFIYRMWAAIQDGHARTTPGQAVGFLFIPFFNFYWAFQAFGGFARDYNTYLQRHGLGLRPLPVGLFHAFAILCLLALVPFVGLLVTIAVIVVGLVMIARTCDAVNSLPPAA